MDSDTSGAHILLAARPAGTCMGISAFPLPACSLQRLWEHRMIRQQNQAGEPELGRT